jgi:hypothetical protein
MLPWTVSSSCFSRSAGLEISAALFLLVLREAADQLLRLALVVGVGGVGSSR